MIGIKVNNEWLDLGNVNINFTFQNPIFSKLMFPKFFSFNFTIPLTGKNVSILDQINYINNISTNVSIEAKVYYQNNLLINGKLFIKELSDKAISVNIQSEGLDLQKIFSETKISDIELDTIFVYPDTETSAVAKQSAWNTHLIDYVNKLSNGEVIKTHHFPPIKANNIYDGSENITFLGEVNRYYWYGPSIQGYYQVVGFDSAVNHPNSFADAVSPCVKTKYLLTEIFKAYGYELKINDFMMSELMEELIIYSANMIDNVATEGIRVYNVYLPNYKLNNYLPNVTIVDFLKLFSELFTCIIVFNEKSIEIVQVDVSLNTSETKDYTNYANPSHKLTPLKKANYKFKYTVNTEEKYFKESADFKEMYIDLEGETDIEISSSFGRPLSTLASDFNVSLSIYNHLSMLALDKVIGKSIFLPDSAPIDKVYLGVYRGYYENYPVFSNVTHCNLVAGDNIKIANDSLLWYGEDGIVNKQWQNSLVQMNFDNEIEKELYLPIHIVEKLGKFKENTHYIWSNYGNFKGVISQFTFSISNKGITPVKIKYKSKI